VLDGARENGYVAILDTSAQNTPFFASTTIDVTQDIRETLRSGVSGEGWHTCGRDSGRETNATAGKRLQHRSRRSGNARKHFGVSLFVDAPELHSGAFSFCLEHVSAAVPNVQSELCRGDTPGVLYTCANKGLRERDL